MERVRHGQYRRTYADDNALEYLAEGVRNWYDTNVESRQEERATVFITTSARGPSWLPMMYALLSKIPPDASSYSDCCFYGG